MTVIFSIETSCDETSAAVIKDGREILGHTVASQEAIHAKYGGVFPEVASRKHIEVISPIVTEALEQAQISLISTRKSQERTERGSLLTEPSESATKGDLNHPYYWAPFILIGNGL